MRKLKIIIGLTSIVFCLLICIQTIVVGIYNANIYNTKFTFSIDIYFSLYLLVVGILVFLNRNSVKKGVSILSVVLYLINMIIGLKYLGIFGNLKYYADASFVFALMLIIGMSVQQIAIKKKMI